MEWRGRDQILPRTVGSYGSTTESSKAWARLVAILWSPAQVRMAAGVSGLSYCSAEGSVMASYLVQTRWGRALLRLAAASRNGHWSWPAAGIIRELRPDWMGKAGVARRLNIARSDRLTVRASSDVR